MIISILNKPKNQYHNMENILSQFRDAKAASRVLLNVDTDTINKVLLAVADAAEANALKIIDANARDLAKMDPEDTKYDRLLLNEQRISDIAADMRNVASLKSPLGNTLEKIERPNGMVITKVVVPFGVIGVIYEARPNVSFDVFSLCFKTGNVAVLKGGSDAEESNKAIVSIIHEVLESFGLDKNICTLLPATREATTMLLNAVGHVDLLIPRGSSNLINFVRDNARIPVIETGAGVCHAYFDKSGDVAKGASIINNAKTRRVSVCNSLDCLIIHKDRLSDLPDLVKKMSKSNVIIYADTRSYELLKGNYPDNLLTKADGESFGTEFMDYKMSVYTADSIENAIEHIYKYSSRHSEAIITEDEEAKNMFERLVDAACVYWNVSTAFTDGAQFGFGAEIGISTQKLHARGPMALKEITSYKYIIEGDGQIRNS